VGCRAYFVTTLQAHQQTCLHVYQDQLKLDAGLDSGVIAPQVLTSLFSMAKWIILLETIYPRSPWAFLLVPRCVNKWISFIIWIKRFSCTAHWFISRFWYTILIAILGQTFCWNGRGWIRSRIRYGCVQAPLKGPSSEKDSCCYQRWW